MLGHVPERLLSWTAVVLSGLVLLSFGLFAIDEGRGASSASQTGIAGTAAAAPVPSPRQEALRERAHQPAREAIDDATDVLLSPLAIAVPDDGGVWAQRGIPTLLALVLYGAGLGYLARFTKARG